MEEAKETPLSYVPAPLLDTSHVHIYSIPSQEAYEESSSICFLDMGKWNSERVTTTKVLPVSGKDVCELGIFCLYHHTAFLPEGSWLEPNTLRAGKYHNQLDLLFPVAVLKFSLQIYTSFLKMTNLKLFGNILSQDWHSTKQFWARGPCFQIFFFPQWVLTPCQGSDRRK